MKGERLKALREDRDLSQTQIGNIIGIGKHSISTWERNIAEPNDDHKIALAKFFDVSIDYLCGLSDDRKPCVRLSDGKLELFLPPGFPKEGIEDLKKYFDYLVQRYLKK